VVVGYGFTANITAIGGAGALARLGLARLGLARLGLARLGLARLGLARLGLARLGLADPPEDGQRPDRGRGAGRGPCRSQAARRRGPCHRPTSSLGHAW